MTDETRCGFFATDVILMFISSSSDSRVRSSAAPTGCDNAMLPSIETRYTAGRRRIFALSVRCLFRRRKNGAGRGESDFGQFDIGNTGREGLGVPRMQDASR